jgi:hypothetical protein
MTEVEERKSRLQAYLDEVTENELNRFPELTISDTVNEIDRQGTMIAHIWDNLYPILYVEKNFICVYPKPQKSIRELTEKEKDTIRNGHLAKILGLKAEGLPRAFQHGMPNERLRQRLERTFVAVNLFMRIFKDPLEFRRNLSFKRPELHGKSPIEAWMAGNTDKVLYFVVMSAGHHDVQF